STRDHPCDSLIVGLLTLMQCTSLIEDYHCSWLDFCGFCYIKFFCTISTRQSNITGNFHISYKDSCTWPEGVYCNATDTRASHTVAGVTLTQDCDTLIAVSTDPGIWTVALNTAAGSSVVGPEVPSTA